MKNWIEFGQSDALPCPKCGSKDLDFFANVVACIECDHYGPAQTGPEFMCCEREAINDWNIAAGGTDHHGRSRERLVEQGLIPASAS